MSNTLKHSYVLKKKNKKRKKNIKIDSKNVRKKRNILCPLAMNMEKNTIIQAQHTNQEQ